jgi:hypothetical protein
MAYSFGGGVRPELGKTDYSGYLQGALTGAQGVAAGGAAIGQGIEKLGAGIGEGIKKYQENKVIVGQLTAKNEDALKDEKFKATLPAGAQALIKKAETNGNLGFKDASVLAAYVDAGKISQKETFNKTLSTQTAQAFGMMQKTGSTNLPLIYQNILPEARVAASNLFVNDQLKRAQTDQASGSAYASRNPTPKTIPTYDKQVAADVSAFVLENGRNPNATEFSKISQNVATRGVAQQFQSLKDQIEVQEGLSRSREALSYNSGIIQASDDSRKYSRDIERAIQLLSEDTSTGFGADWILKGRQIGKALGFDTESTANGEELRVLLGNQVMARVAQTKGAVSDREMALYTQYSANYGNSTEGNMQILKFAKAAYDRSIDTAAKIREWRKQGLTAGEVYDKVQEYQSKNELVFEDPAGFKTVNGKPFQKLPNGNWKPI